MTAMSGKQKPSDMPAPLVMQIDVRSIDIPGNHRKHSRADIEAMAEIIAARGQLQPIEIERRGDSSDRYRLIFGALRLQATILNGSTTITAIVRERDEFATEGARRLRSFTENMAHVRLGALDRAVAIADWCDIYRATQPRLKPGRKPATDELSLTLRPNSDDADLMVASENFTASFSDAAQAFLGISRAGVFRALKIASIPSPQRDRMTLHWLAQSEGELYKLATLKPTDRQVSVLDLILADKAGGVDEALDLLDGRTRNAPSKWEVIHQTFSRLPTADQDHFFDLNEASIDRWQASRKGRR